MIDPAQQGEQIVQKEVEQQVHDVLDHELATYTGVSDREFKIGHGLVLQLHGWTDAPTDDEGRIFGLRLTIARYLNVGIVLGNLGI